MNLKVVSSGGRADNALLENWVFRTASMSGMTGTLDPVSRDVSGYFRVSSDRLKLITEQMVNDFKSSLTQSGLQPARMLLVTPSQNLNLVFEEYDVRPT